MNWEIILVLSAIVFLLLSLYLEWFRATTSFFIVIILFTITEIISPKEALGGFANEQLAVVVLLLTFSTVLSKSSVTTKLFDFLFKNAKGTKTYLARMILFITPSSAFFNNTPLVSMMMPYTYEWCRRTNHSPSKFLIPLSYAAIIGGCTTLIGTSTNLVVNGLAIDAGFESLNIFDFTFVGICMLVFGGIFLVFFSEKLLPSKTNVAKEDLVESSREYFIETVVESNSKLIGKSVKDAKLRNLKGLFLIEIVRGINRIAPVSPEEPLEEDDKLIFTGATDNILELKNPAIGLSLPKHCEITDKDKADLVEIVISYNSAFIGKKVMFSDFRGKFDGAILAIHRNGERLEGKIGEIILKAGDVLLLIAGPDFHKRIEGNRAFYLLTTYKGGDEIPDWKAYVMLGGLFASIIISATTDIKLFSCLLLLFGVILGIKVVSPNEIRKGMDFNLIMLMVSGLALGKAMINSGAAELIAESVIYLAPLLGPVLLLGGIFIVTNLLSSYITNLAAVAIIFPISVTIAQQFNFDIKPFILIVAFGAAANFLTPIGYQTNLMVYGPGGYSFKDFFRIGLPLTIIYMLVCVIALSIQFNFL